MRTKIDAMVGALMLAAACQRAPQAEAEPDPAPQPEVVQVEPTPHTEVPKPVDPPPPAPEPAKPVEPPPPFVELPSDPAIDALQFLLGDGHPEHVTVVAVDEHGRHRLVLYRLDLAARWTASRPEDDPVLARLEEDFDACDEEDPYGYLSCRETAARAARVPQELIEHLAEPDGHAWEIAHVEFDREAKARVLARKRLLNHGQATDEGLAEFKLEVYDMDGDKRSEVLVVFSVVLEDEGALELSEAAVGYVLDKADLHVQFATTRNYLFEASDLSTHRTEIETTWLARDENGDGYNDLVVRERKLEHYNPGEADLDASPTSETSNRSTVCMYELAGDRWVCPDSLGTEVIDGSKMVEVTTVPVVVEPPPP